MQSKASSEPIILEEIYHTEEVLHMFIHHELGPHTWTRLRLWASGYELHNLCLGYRVSNIGFA